MRVDPDPDPDPDTVMRADPDPGTVMYADPDSDPDPDPDTVMRAEPAPSRKCSTGGCMRTVYMEGPCVQPLPLMLHTRPWGRGTCTHEALGP